MFILGWGTMVCDAFSIGTLRPQQPSTFGLHMSPDANWWEPTWTTVEIIASDPACDSGKSRAIRVSAPEDLRDSYMAPGQFIQVQEIDGENEDNPNFCFLPFASSPRADHFEFLVKDRDDRSWLLDCKVGTKLQLSGVLGKGFQPREANPDPLAAMIIVLASKILGRSPFAASLG